MKRREFLTTAASTLSLTTLHAEAKNMILPPLAAFDHALLAINNLQTGIDYVRQLTGVQAKVGGVHPHLGTMNALMSLGNNQYLEIIAPNPEGTLVDRYKYFTGIEKPRLIGWAARTSRVEEIEKIGKSNNYKTDGIQPGQRKTGDGKLLSWKTIAFETPAGQSLPFFIQWGEDTPHPSTTSPTGCTLSSFTVFHSKPDAARKVLGNFSLTEKVLNGKDGEFELKIKSGNTEVVFKP